MMENIKFSALTFSMPGVHNYTIKEISPSGYGWTTDDRVYRVNIVVTADECGDLIATAYYPDGEPLFTNIFSCIPTQITLRATKIICGICTKYLKKYDCIFLFDLYNEDGERISTAYNFEEMIVFPKLLFTGPGTYKYIMKELPHPLCPCWATDTTVYPIEITVAPNIEGRLEANVYFPNGNPVFINNFNPSHCCDCNKLHKCIKCGQCNRYDNSIPTCY
ncbi:MAG: hypothetical protein FWC93_01080 [Defluviitaleaceae bacterium]|nr:hypothetical protein [Defluviitaleaceae bacterium]